MLANAILEALTGVFHDETRWDGARTLKHELQERPRMVIVDGAQNAGLDCIECLRWLHEEVPGRLTLLFVGGPQVRTRVMKSPQLTRRSFQPTGFRALPAASVLATIRSSVRQKTIPTGTPRSRPQPRSLLKNSRHLR